MGRRCILQPSADKKRQGAVMFNLRDVEPIAQGHKRFVYQHPDQPNLLIKVMQPDVVEERWGSANRPWYKTTRRYGQYMSLRRELSEYLAAAVKFPDGVPVLQRLAGIVDTDYGIGVVVEKLVGRDGELAPTLAKVVRGGGVTPELLQKLGQLTDELIKYNIVVGKLHAHNMVLAVRGGEERFVVIDGYGATALIPIHTWSDRINAAHTRSRLKRLIRDVSRERGPQAHR
jgi:hypothetical protein